MRAKILLRPIRLRGYRKLVTDISDICLMTRSAAAQTGEWKLIMFIRLSVAAGAGGGGTGFGGCECIPKRNGAVPGTTARATCMENVAPKFFTSLI